MPCNLNIVVTKCVIIICVICSIRYLLLVPYHLDTKAQVTDGNIVNGVLNQLRNKDVSSNALQISLVDDLIQNLQKTTLDILKETLAEYYWAILFDLSNIENKGDPAIGIGELNYLAHLNIKVISYHTYTATEKEMDTAKQLSALYPPERLVVLSNGGGNFGGYKYNDYKRASILKRFPDHKFLLFSQSTWFDFDDGSHLKFVQWNFPHTCGAVH